MTLGTNGLLSGIQRMNTSSNKVVVTTTISSEGASGAPVMAPEALDTLSHAAPAQLQQMASDGRILMVKIAPRTYLGLTDGRRNVSPLQIDENLFIFAPREDALIHLAELVAELVRGLPENASTSYMQAKINEFTTSITNRI